MRRAVPGLALLAAAAAILGSSGPTRAERLVLSLSTNLVAIGSNYTGDRMVLFGVIQHEPGDPAAAGKMDVVVTVSGPREALTVRQKERLGPVWVNRSQQKFVSVPAVLGVYASRPPEEIASAETRQRLRLSLEAIVNAPEFTADRGEADDPFRTALVRLKRREGLWTERPRSVTFVTDEVFRVQMPLPAIAPTGNYDVEATLFSDGMPVAKREASFEVVKAGFEEQVTMTARDHGLPYGLAIAGMSILFGWLASIIFRRD